MKIIILHSNNLNELLPLMSLLIGLKKKYEKSSLIWIGCKKYFSLIKYNKRVKTCFDIEKEYNLSDLTAFYGSEICINTSWHKSMTSFSSLVGAKKYFGFDKNGPVNHAAEFFYKVMNYDITTNKTVLDMYYSLADLKWGGEGYGLSYYPKLKQNKKYGIFAEKEDENYEEIDMPNDLLRRFDVINQYEQIKTDDLFTLHASLALRKKAIFCEKLPYKLNFSAKILK